jgi:hypothetical protein
VRGKAAAKFTAGLLHVDAYAIARLGQFPCKSQKTGLYAAHIKLAEVECYGNHENTDCSRRRRRRLFSQCEVHCR